MADLSQTAANVGVQSANAIVQLVQVGETITQGEPLYKKSTGLYHRADADDSAMAEATGIALTPGDANGWVVMQTLGKIDLGATLTVGETYVVSTNVGNIAPIGDLATGDYNTILGVATAADELDININASGVQVP